MILGYGAIGEALERRLSGFECEVIRVARRERDGVHPISELPELLPRADVVVLLTPATPETTRMVDAKFLASMKDGALLVNVARGVVVDTDALLTELGTRRISAALDVTDPEPLPAGHPLWSAPNVLINPHRGGASTAFAPRVARLVRAQLERYASGEPLHQRGRRSTTLGGGRRCPRPCTADRNQEGSLDRPERRCPQAVATGRTGP